MSCGCKSPNSVESWYDLAKMTPQDPLDLIAYAVLGSETGIPANSTSFAAPLPGSVWIASPITITSGPSILTNATDIGMMNQDAIDWNFSHKTADLATSVAPPLRKMIFMRGGLQWTNVFSILIPSSPTFSLFELSFLENAATRGDAQGTVPVIRWNTASPYSGAKTVTIVLKRPGRFVLGLMGVNTNSTPDWTMLEIDIVAV